MNRLIHIIAGAAIVAVIAVIVALVAYAVDRERECGARGGVLVQGQFQYVCVAAAKVAP